MTAQDEPATTRPGRAWGRRALSVRTLMLVVLAAGLGEGWSARVLTLRREALATIRAANGSVSFRDQNNSASGVWVALYRRTGWEFAREITAVNLRRPPARPPASGESVPPAPPSRDEVFAALGRLGTVETLVIEAGPIRPGHREALAAAGVVVLDIGVRDGLVLDESLAELAQVRSLRALSILAAEGTVLPRSILRWTGAVTPLRRLSIQGISGPAPATSPALEADATTLAGFADLESLYLSPSPSDGAFLDGLAGTHRLRDLTAQATRVTDAQLRRLAEREPDLEGVVLDGSLLSDAGTEALGRLARLQRLSLSGRPSAGPGITDTTLATVAQLKVLRVLFLTCGRFTDRGLEALRGASRIEALDLDQVESASNEVLTRLLAGRTWRALGLRGPGITDTSLPAILPHVGNGTSLMLAHSGLTDAGMEALATVPARSIVLNGTALTDAGLASLSRAPALSQVDARGTKVTDAGAAAFRRARGGRSIVNLGPLRPEDE